MYKNNDNNDNDSNDSSNYNNKNKNNPLIIVIICNNITLIDMYNDNENNDVS